MNKSVKLLLIEDDDFDFRLFKKELKSSIEKFDFQRTDTISKSIELIEQWTPDYIILDMVLPDSRVGEGLTTLLQHAPDAKYLLISNHAPFHLDQLTKNEQVIGFVNKSKLETKFKDYIQVDA